MLSNKSIEALQEVLSKRTSALKSNLDVRRNVFLTVDKYLQKESDRTETGQVGKLVNHLGDKSKIRDTEIPVAFIQTQTAIAYLSGIFLGGEPIFAATSDRKNEDGAVMLTQLSQRDQHRLNWRGELLTSIARAVKYNVSPCEVVWGEKRASSVKSKILPDQTKTGEIAPVIYEGNIIRSIDPYNFFCDETVEPHEVHEFGAHAGYVQRFNYTRLKKFVAELPNQFVVRKSLKEAFASSCKESLHYIPQIRSLERIGDPNDWSGFWGTNPSVPPDKGGGKYEVVTMYARLIPREYFLDVAKAGTLAVYKLIYVNNILLYAEHVQTPHEYLPIIVGQLYRGPWELKSFAEYVLDLQDLGTSMIRGTMDSMRRAVSDRMIYDPTRIRKADIDASNPVSKIPVTTNAYQTDIRTAAYQIPYEDRMSSSFRQNLGLILQLADQTTGQNPAAQGSFMKGNKTRFEFDEIMTNSEARMQLGALELDCSLFAPVRQIIATNYLVFAQAETVNDRITGEPIEIDPETLRNVVPEFKMASGILPSTKIANTEVLMQGMQIFSSLPNGMLEWDIPGMVVSILKQQGATDLDAYKRTPEQQQQLLQYEQARAAAAAPQGPPPQQ